MPSSTPTACALSASGPQQLPGLCLESLDNHKTSGRQCPMACKGGVRVRNSSLPSGPEWCQGLARAISRDAPLPAMSLVQSLGELKGSTDWRGQNSGTPQILVYAAQAVWGITGVSGL